jgi:hypothetical protein
MALQHEYQDVLEFIDKTISELESELEDKKVEAETKGWHSTGKKYQAINELYRHILSLKRIRIIQERNLNIK